MSATSYSSAKVYGVSPYGNNNGNNNQPPQPQPQPQQPPTSQTLINSTTTYRSRTSSSSSSSEDLPVARIVDNTILSNIEQELLRTKQPLMINERETVSAGPYRGIYLNKSEVDRWRGPLPVEQYKLNEDPNPEVLRKRLDKIKYTQECNVRYLNPPPLPKPGDLVIRERQQTLPPAPPLIVRLEGGQAAAPPPMIYREQPPVPPPRIPEQVIEVDGVSSPPPPRRVVVEKLSNLPPKPQDIIVERWLPYRQQKRRVVYQRAAQSAAPPRVRNLIIEWEAPEVEVEKVCKDLGVVDANPEEYIRRYGPELKSANELPDCSKHCGQQQPPPQRRISTTEVHVERPVDPCCCQCKPVVPCCCNCNGNRTFSSTTHIITAATGHSAHSRQYQQGQQQQFSNQQTIPVQYQQHQQQPQQPTLSNSFQHQQSQPNQQQQGGFSYRNLTASSSLPDLEGDIEALKLIDLDRYGLSAYKQYVKHVSL